MLERRTSILFLLVLGGCNANLPLDAAVIVACGADGACPDGTVCVGGERCVAPANVDTQGPAMLLPAENAVVRNNVQTVFAWQPIPGASSYTLTIAGDVSLTQPIAGAPLTTTSTVASVSLPPGTLYWTVSSDITSTSSAPTGRLLGVVSDTVYARCLANADCDHPGLELGTKEYPYASIARSITAAQILGVTYVAVANRGSNVVYAEAIIVSNGINVDGGYDPSFNPWSTRTPIMLATTPLVAVGIIAPTVIKGFALTSGAPAGMPSTVVRIVQSGSGLEIRDVTIGATAIYLDLVRVEDGIDSVGPLIADSSITMLYTGASGALGSDLSAVNVGIAGVLRMANTTIDVTGTAAGQTLVGVNIEAGAVDLEGVTVVVDGGYEAEALSAQQARSIHIHDSHLETRNASALVQTLSTNATTGPTVIDASTVIAVSSVAATAILLADKGAAHITSTVIQVGDTDHAIAMLLNGGPPAVVTNNTIELGNISAYGDGIRLYGRTASLVNNLILARNPACTESAQPCIAGVREINGYDLALFNNVFAGFVGGDACGYYAAEGCLDAQLNTPRATTDKAALGGNQTSAIAALGLSTDLRPPASGILAGAGHDPRADDCVMSISDPSLPPPRADAPSCGPAPTDRDGVQHDATPTIGAYEP